ncbi:MAG: hypothetical protein L6Q26_13220 [Anaerolineales bacterium]|nr:hypothetical protein [Anaerolineales bacterium]
MKWSQSRVKDIANIENSYSADEKALIRTAATDLHQLAQIERELGNSNCIESYQEAAKYYERIEDNAASAVAAFNLGHAYMQLPACGIWTKPSAGIVAVWSY